MKAKQKLFNCQCNTCTLLKFHLVWADKQRPFRVPPHPPPQGYVNDSEQRGRRCWGFGREEASWWRSVERSGRLYLSRTVYQLPLFQLLMTCVRVFPLKAPRGRNWGNKGLLHSSVLMSSFPSSFFLSVLFLEDERWASQKAVHSHATAASKLISLSPFWCCIYLRVQSCVQLVCLTGWTIKSPCGMLMSSYFTAQHTAGSLWSVCTANQRLTEAMGLARLAENMTGVLICQQVVSLNDGRADSPVECSSEWVGCGMTVWGHPTFSHGAPSVNETRPHRKLPPPTSLLFVQGGGPELAGILNLHKLLPGCPHLLPTPLLTFVMCLEIVTEWYGHNRQIWT